MGGLTIAGQVYIVYLRVSTAFNSEKRGMWIFCRIFCAGNGIATKQSSRIDWPSQTKLPTSYMFVCTQSTVDMSDSVMVAVIIKLKGYISSGLKLSYQSSTRM